MVASSTRNETKYSLTRCSMDDHEAKIQSGIRNAVSTAKGSEKPSTPSLNRILSVSQRCVSTSWNWALPGSKRLQATSDKAKVATVVISAAHLEFERTASSSPRNVR